MKSIKAFLISVLAVSCLFADILKVEAEIEARSHCIDEQGVAINSIFRCAQINSIRANERMVRIGLARFEYISGINMRKTGVSLSAAGGVAFATLLPFVITENNFVFYSLTAIGGASVAVGIPILRKGIAKERRASMQLCRDNYFRILSTRDHRACLNYRQINNKEVFSAGFQTCPCFTGWQK